MRDLLARTMRDRLLAHPRAAAVHTEAATISYGELIGTAGLLETLISDLGVAPGSVVAIVGRQGLGLYLGLLATLLSGRVPAAIDAAQPPERIDCQLKLAAPALVMTVGADSGLARRADLPTCVATLDLDGDTPRLTRRTPAAPAGAHADDVGYIAFTSGSLGAPKALAGSASGLVHFISWQRSHFGVAAGDRFAQLTSPSFDVFYRDVLTPLTAGAALCVPAPEQQRGAGVLDWLSRAQVTHLHAVPSLATYWLRDRRGWRGPGLTLTFFAGEPLPGSLAARWREVTGNGRVVNFYGTAEATLAQSFYEIPADCGEKVQPVGRPIPGITIRVADWDGNTVADGCQGEVIVESPYVSHGVLDGTVSAVPVVHPLPTVPGAVPGLRTGDRGRWGADGLLYLEGRLDREVKVRGVRVDLDGVAAALAGHSLVRQAVVVPAGDPVGGLRLEAIVAIGDGPAPTVRQLKAYLARFLPEPMIPARISIRAEIPLSATGKAMLRVEKEP